MMKPTEGCLEGWELETSFEVFPSPSFILKVYPFFENSESFCEFTLMDVIQQAVMDRIALKENPKVISHYLRLVADEIEGMCHA